MPVVIEKPVYGGDFLARVEGKAIFAPLTLPGERVRLTILEDKRSFAMARVGEVLAASPGRVAPGCTHFGSCGGCHYQHAGYELQLAMKQAILRETLSRAGVAVPAEIAVLAAEPWGYRNRIRLAIAQSSGPNQDTSLGAVMGYRGRQSHRVVEVAECPIAAPLLLDAAQAFSLALTAMPSPGPVRELELFTDAEQTQLLANIVAWPTAAQGAEQERWQGWLKEICLATRPRLFQLTGATVQACEPLPSQPRSGVDPVGDPAVGLGNTRILGRWGNDALTYSAAGFGYRVPAGAFFQVNRWLVDALVERVTAGRGGRLAWDLYAGVGLFARKLAGNFERVVAVESAPVSVEGLKQNLAGTCGEVSRSATLEFLLRRQQPTRRRSGGGTTGAPEEMVPDSIVVDPPRAGLGAETVSLLASSGAQEIVYVSCDPATLARDLRGMTQGGYRLTDLAMADLFPQTFHLEAVATLRRA